MDFKAVLTFISKEFSKADVTYALIGGIALSCRGVFRTTTDVDFLVKKEHRDKIKSILTRFNYTVVYESENVIQFNSDLAPFGTIVFLYAFRPISMQMLDDAEEMPVFETNTMPVLKTEELFFIIQYGRMV